MAKQRFFEFGNLPLVLRMAGAVPRLAKPGVEDEYREIVNVLRRYSVSSIVDCALAHLDRAKESRTDEMLGLPWLVLLLVKWALQDQRVKLRIGSPLPSSVFVGLVNRLWNSGSSKEYGNPFLLIRSHLHAQIEFQRPLTFGFMRWAALYARLEPNSTARKQFRAALKMEPEQFIDVAFLFLSSMPDASRSIGPDFFSALSRTHGEALQQFEQLLVRDLVQLRTELSGDKAQRVRGKKELLEFPYLKRFPLLRLRDGRIRPWHPLVFARGVEDLIHITLSDNAGEEYTRAFSRVFEEYVVELGRNTTLPAITEIEFQNIVGKGEKAVELILRDEKSIILIEAKMSYFRDDVLLEDNEEQAFQKTNRLRAAMKQGGSVAKNLLDDPIKFGVESGSKCYLLVVTSRDLIISNGEMYRQMIGGGTGFEAPPADVLPLSQIFFVAIEDYEILMTSVANGRTKLADLLSKAVTSNQSNLTARLTLPEFVERPERQGVSKLLDDASSHARIRLASALGVPSLYPEL